MCSRKQIRYWKLKAKYMQKTFAKSSKHSDSKNKQKKENNKKCKCEAFCVTYKRKIKPV